MEKADESRYVDRFYALSCLPRPSSQSLDPGWTWPKNGEVRRRRHGRPPSQPEGKATLGVHLQSSPTREVCYNANAGLADHRGSLQTQPHTA
jgi:hypothetical protein